MSSRDWETWLEEQINLAYTKASKGKYQQAILIELETIREILILYAKPKIKSRGLFSFVGFVWDWLKKAFRYYK